jgi:adenylate cyclase
MSHDRRLAAILFTDIVGYTSMMQKDEIQALTIVRRHNRVVQENSKIHGGEVVNFYGDGCLAVFPSATEAVQCAVDIQKALREDLVVPVRIGLHIGEIFFEDGKVIGDGVNVASRVQSLGQANTILISAEIMDKIKNRSEFRAIPLGSFEFKNVDRPMEVFALDIEGLSVPKRESLEGKLKTDASNAIKKVNNKAIPVLITLLVFIAISVLAYYQFFNKNSFTGKEKSIAVLPFETSGLDSNNVYLSDGLTQDIINKLSRLSALKTVTGWASVRIYKNTGKSINDIAGELGVASILTGSIQKNDDKLHINAELIDVNSGKRIWGDDFDRKMGDLLSIQGEVAQKIATALKSGLTPEERVSLSKNYTENVEAFKYYSKGRFFLDKRNRESYDSAEANFNHALQLDPGFALAYSGLADFYSTNQKGLTQLESVPLAREYALKALSLDGNLSEALTTMGFIESTFDYDWMKSKETFEKAILLNPNYPLTHLYYGNLLIYTEENAVLGFSEIKKALSLDPLSSTSNLVLGRAYYFMKNYDSAYKQIKKTLILDPVNMPAKVLLALVLFAQKNYTEAFDIIKQFPSRGNIKQVDQSGLLLSYGYGMAGDTSRARAEMEKSIKENPEQSPFLLARCFISLGKYDKALSELERAYNIRDIRMFGLKIDPTLDPVRNLPGFKLLKKKMNLN